MKIHIIVRKDDKNPMCASVASAKTGAMPILLFLDEESAEDRRTIVENPDLFETIEGELSLPEGSMAPTPGWGLPNPEWVIKSGEE